MKINSKSDLLYAIIWVAALIWVAYLCFQESKQLSSMKAHFGVTVGIVESQYTIGGKYLNTINVRYQVGNRKLIEQTLPFSARTEVPHYGEKCLLVYDLTAPKTVALVVNINDQSLEYGTYMNDRIDTTRITFTWTGAAKYISLDAHGKAR